MAAFTSCCLRTTTADTTAGDTSNPHASQSNDEEWAYRFSFDHHSSKHGSMQPRIKCSLVLDRNVLSCQQPKHFRMPHFPGCTSPQMWAKLQLVRLFDQTCLSLGTSIIRTKTNNKEQVLVMLVTHKKLAPSSVCLLYTSPSPRDS